MENPFKVLFDFHIRIAYVIHSWYSLPSTLLWKRKTSWLEKNQIVYECVFNHLNPLQQLFLENLSESEGQ